jgi:hypothetical protein
VRDEQRLQNPCSPLRHVLQVRALLSGEPHEIPASLSYADERT